MYIVSGIGATAVIFVYHIKMAFIWQIRRAQLSVPTKFILYVFTFTYLILVWQEAFWKTDNPVKLEQDIYLLLTQFEVRTVSYGPSFSPSIYGPSAKRAGHKSWGKKRGSVTYSTDREDEVRKVFIISLLCVWRVRKRFPFYKEQLQNSEPGRKQNESIWNRW